MWDMMWVVVMAAAMVYRSVAAKAVLKVAPKAAGTALLKAVKWVFQLVAGKVVMRADEMAGPTVVTTDWRKVAPTAALTVGWKVELSVAQKV